MKHFHTTYFAAISKLVLAVVILMAFTRAYSAPEVMQLKYLGSYQTGKFNVSAAEIAAYEPTSHRVYISGATEAKVWIVDISNPAAPVKVGICDCSTLGGSVNSVAVYGNVVAIAVEGFVKTDAGKVALFDLNGNFIKAVTVGALPDMLTFTHDGKFVLTCNEGEPNDSYTIDPEGSVSIVDMRNGAQNATVQTAEFKAYIGTENFLRSQGIRIFGPNANAAQDFEPEYLAVSDDNTRAYVTLQENNAIACIDIPNASVIWVKALGTKDHMLAGNELDASDKDSKINIQNWPVYGLYLPDAIAQFKHNGRNYFVTANEGDSRDYSGFSEEARVSDLTLDPVSFPNASTLQKNANLGRLKVTKTLGDANKDGKYEALYSYGARSFSIWDDNGNLIFDSGSDFEKITAQLLPTAFNNNNSENAFDGRSDDKGPEPEGVTVASIQGHRYAFICFERIGGVMVYNIDSPTAPYYVTYINHRNFSAPFPGSPSPAQLTAIGDLGPESLIVVDKSQSPNGYNLCIVANEVSGSLSIFQIITQPQVNLQNITVCSGTPSPIVNANKVADYIYYGSGNYTYNWHPSGILNLTMPWKPIWTNPNFTQNFSLTVTDNETGLTSSGAMTVTVNQGPNFTLPVLINIPKNSSVNLASQISNVTGVAPFSYSWMQENMMLQDPTNVIPPVGLTKFYATVMDAQSCTSMTKRVVTYVSVLKDIAQNDLILSDNANGVLYANPVPVNDFMNVFADFTIADGLTLKVLDLNGKVVLNKNYPGAKSINENVGMSSLPAGSYILSIESSTDKVSKKFIKN